MDRHFSPVQIPVSQALYISVFFLSFLHIYLLCKHAFPQNQDESITERVVVDRDRMDSVQKLFCCRVW